MKKLSFALLLFLVSACAVAQSQSMGGLTVSKANTIYVRLDGTNWGTNPFTLPPFVTDPTVAGEGKLIWNTTSKKVRVYNGTSWDEVGAVPDLSGYVPYTGATGGVDIGVYPISGAEVLGGSPITTRTVTLQGGNLQMSSTNIEVTSATDYYDGEMHGSQMWVDPNTVDREFTLGVNGFSFTRNNPSSGATETWSLGDGTLTANSSYLSKGDAVVDGTAVAPSWLSTNRTIDGVASGTVTVQPDGISYDSGIGPSLTVDDEGLVYAGGSGELAQLFSDGSISATSTVTGSTLTSTATTGTPPLSVASTSLVTNLNADLLDGNHASAFLTAETDPRLPSCPIGQTLIMGATGYECATYPPAETDPRLPAHSTSGNLLTSNGSAWTSAAPVAEADGVVGNEVTNATNATLTRSGAGTSGDPYTLGLNLGNANTWTAAQIIDGSTDAVQLTVQGNATQTALPFVVEASGGTDVFTVSNTGAIGTASSSGLAVKASRWQFFDLYGCRLASDAWLGFSASGQGDASMDVGITRGLSGSLQVTSGGAAIAGTPALAPVIASLYGFSSAPSTAADLSLSRSAAGVLKVTDGSTGYGSIGAKAFVPVSANLTANDVTPDVSTASVWKSVANSGATVLTDLDSPIVGAFYTIICGSATNPISIADGAPFSLSAAWAPDSVGDNIVLYVNADNDYYEISRSNN